MESHGITILRINYVSCYRTAQTAARERTAGTVRPYFKTELRCNWFGPHIKKAGIIRVRYCEEM